MPPTQTNTNQPNKTPQKANKQKPQTKKTKPQTNQKKKQPPHQKKTPPKNPNTTKPSQILENDLKLAKYSKNTHILKLTVMSVSPEIVYSDGIRVTEAKHILSMLKLNDYLCFPYPDGCLLEPKEMTKGTVKVLNS